ncbi:MAG: RNA-binding protein [Candidatus Pacearchaeota archaeon]|jgi:RNA recognition motif-containing protein
MAKRLYVGNLPFSVTQEALKNFFSAFKSVGEVTIVVNKFSGRSKGFGFVEISDDEEAEKAIAELNGKDLEGRALFVSEARPFDPDKPRPERRSFGGREGGRSGGYGGGRSGGFGGGRRFDRGDGEGRRSYNQNSDD